MFTPTKKRVRKEKDIKEKKQIKITEKKIRMAVQQGDEEIGVFPLQSEEKDTIMTSPEVKEVEEKVLEARKTAELVMKEKERQEPPWEMLMRMMSENREETRRNVEEINKGFERVDQRLKETREEVFKIMNDNFVKLRSDVRTQVDDINIRIDQVEERFGYVEARMGKQEDKIQKIEESTEKYTKSKIRVAEEKVNKKLDEHIEENNLKLKTIQEDMKKIKDDKVESTRDMPSFDRISSGISIAPQLKTEAIPTFQNDMHLHPVEYIKNIREIVRINYKDRCEAFHDEIMYLVRNTLKGEPKLWFNTVNCDFFKTFEVLFLKQYWGSYHQTRCRNDLILGKYDKNRTYRTRERYALELYNKSMYLEPPISQKELITRIADHFGDDISLQVVIKDMDNLNTLIEYLRRIDDNEAQSRQRRSHVNVNNIITQRFENSNRDAGFLNNYNNNNRNQNNYCDNRNQHYNENNRNQNNYNNNRNQNYNSPRRYDSNDLRNQRSIIAHNNNRNSMNNNCQNDSNRQRNFNRNVEERNRRNVNDVPEVTTMHEENWDIPAGHTNESTRNRNF